MSVVVMNAVLSLIQGWCGECGGKCGSGDCVDKDCLQWMW